MPNPVVFLQGNDATSFSSVTTRSTTLTNVSGNLGVVVAHSVTGSATTLTLGADTNGNTWVALTPAGSTQSQVQAWYCLSLKPGSNTVTITDSTAGSLTRGVVFTEWTVTNGTVTFDKQGAHGQTASTTQTTPASGTLSSAAEIVIGYFTTGVAAQTFGNSIGTIEYTSAHTTVDTVVTDMYVSATTSVTQAVTSNSSTSANGITTFAFTASVFSISGNAGIASATVSYSGTASGSVTADGSGNYTISNLPAGPYTITPSLAGYTFTPVNQAETIVSSNITSVNFTAAPSGGAVGWSPLDSRVAVFGFGPGANTQVIDAQGNKIFSAQNPPFTGNSQVSDNAAIPPKDSRAAGAPTDSRVNKPVNSRRAPPF